MLHFLIGLLIVAVLLSFRAGRILALVAVVGGGLFLALVVHNNISDQQQQQQIRELQHQAVAAGNIVGAANATPEELAQGAKLPCFDPAAGAAEAARPDGDIFAIDPRVGQRWCPGQGPMPGWAR